MMSLHILFFTPHLKHCSLLFHFALLTLKFTRPAFYFPLRKHNALIQYNFIQLLITFVLFGHIFASADAINAVLKCYYYFFNLFMPGKEIIIRTRTIVLIYLPTYLPFMVSSFLPVNLSFHLVSFSFNLKNILLPFLRWFVINEASAFVYPNLSLFHLPS